MQAGAREIAELSVRDVIGVRGCTLSGLRKECAELGYAEARINGKGSGFTFGVVGCRCGKFRAKEFSVKLRSEGEV